MIDIRIEVTHVITLEICGRVTDFMHVRKNTFFSFRSYEKKVIFKKLFY